MKTLKTIGSVALISTMLVSCGKDNQINGSSSGGTSSATNYSLSSNVASNAFQALVNATTCQISNTSRRTVGLVLNYSTKKITSSSITDISGVDFTSATASYVGATPAGDLVFVKRTASTDEVYMSLCLPSDSLSSPINASLTNVSNVIPDSTNNGCSYGQVAAFSANLFLQNGLWGTYAFSTLYGVQAATGKFPAFTTICPR